LFLFGKISLQKLFLVDYDYRTEFSIRGEKP